MNNEINKIFHQIKNNLEQEEKINNRNETKKENEKEDATSIQKNEKINNQDIKREDKNNINKITILTNKQNINKDREIEN